MPKIDEMGSMCAERTTLLMQLMIWAGSLWIRSVSWAFGNPHRVSQCEKSLMVRDSGVLVDLVGCVCWLIFAQLQSFKVLSRIA